MGSGLEVYSKTPLWEIRVYYDKELKYIDSKPPNAQEPKNPYNTL